MLSKITRLQEALSKIKGKVGLAFSHQIEDTIAIDWVLQTNFPKERLEIFTLNTHKLFKESLEYQEEVSNFFQIPIQSYEAKGEDLQKVEEEVGLWGMRESLEKRKLCCFLRKIKPLGYALKDKEAWISGLRIAQSVTRADIALVEQDKNFNLIKINPLFDIDDKTMWDYAKSQNLPLNALYAKNFTSIGCEPCTRPIKEGEDIRAGRWWWENPNHKECGLHLKS